MVVIMASTLLFSSSRCSAARGGGHQLVLGTGLDDASFELLTTPTQQDKEVKIEPSLPEWSSLGSFLAQKVVCTLRHGDVILSRPDKRLSIKRNICNLGLRDREAAQHSVHLNSHHPNRQEEQ